ncbi:MAG: acetyl-coenzyme A synthetase N-terminal domain-containing protein, partial [Cryomorphaceae bacterium]
MSHYFLNSFAKYEEAYKASVDNPAAFWEGIAGEFTWQKPWDKTLEWEFNTPNVKWFQGGVLNITENCLDRHLEERGDDIALIWEPNDPKEQE